MEQLRTLNPAYRRDIVPGASEMTYIRLPQTEIGKFIDKQEEICNYKADELMNKRTEVAVNDDAPAYSSRSRSTSRSSTRSSSRSRKTRRSSGAGKSITIKSGQTLSEIARKHGTTVSKLKQLNGIKGTNIRAGKKLRVK